MNLGEEREIYLAKMRRRIERLSGETFSRADIVRLLIDLAMKDEAIFDATDPQSPRATNRRRVEQPEQPRHPTSILGLSSLLRSLEAASHPSDDS